MPVQYLTDVRMYCESCGRVGVPPVFIKNLKNGITEELRFLCNYCGKTLKTVHMDDTMLEFHSGKKVK
jgi:hypothetical protein